MCPARHTRQEPVRDRTASAWTIQPWAVWRRVVAGERLTVDWNYAANLHVAYDWLREQLNQRIAGYSGHYPWWAYDRRPDLRFHRHQHPRGQIFALIELQLPAASIVRLPFWAWDRVFYNRFLAAKARDAANWERRMRKAVPDEDLWPLPSPWHQQLLASWELLFDPALPQSGPCQHSRRTLRQHDIVFEILERSVVRRVVRFRGTNPNRTPRESPSELGIWNGPTVNHRATMEGRTAIAPGCVSAGPRDRS